MPVYDTNKIELLRKNTSIDYRIASRVWVSLAKISEISRRFLLPRSSARKAFGNSGKGARAQFPRLRAFMTSRPGKANPKGCFQKDFRPTLKTSSKAQRRPSNVFTIVNVEERRRSLQRPKSPSKKAKERIVFLSLYVPYSVFTRDLT